MKKRTLWAITACAMAFVLSVGTTYAWLIARDPEVNTFFMGEDNITVVETFTPPTSLFPNQTIPKNPRIQNTGNLPTFVRARIVFSSAEAKALCNELIIGSSDWEYVAADDYYYYKKLLMPGQFTPYLFENVVIRGNKTAEEMIDFDIIVYSESRIHLDHDSGDCELRGQAACAGNLYRTVWN